MNEAELINKKYWDKNMKIGILYICTGKYQIFWKDFYLSCEKNFIPEAEKIYYVFTDSPAIEFETDNKNINKIYQENLGWPDNTLKRYQIFLKIEERLKKVDYIFFFNANLLFLEDITAEEFLPFNQEKLVGCLHPGYYNQTVLKYPYEKNPKSKAFIKAVNGRYYYAGGINGGETEYFIKTIKKINNNIEEDLKYKIIAAWHDESYWNKYLNECQKITKTISPSYLYPENTLLPFEKKILIRDKDLLGGHSYFRNTLELKLIINKTKRIIKNIFHTKKLIKLQGGLGNQLFQYAYGRNLEYCGEKIVFDTSFFSGNKAKMDTARNYKLGNYNISTQAKFSNDKHPLMDIFDKLKRRLGFGCECFYQSEKYFYRIKDIIKQEFTLKNPLSAEGLKWQGEILNTKNSVSLHVRRGDYVQNEKTNKFHGTCSIEYYQKAIDILKKKLDNQDPEIFVISDDIDWVKENLSLPTTSRYISNPDLPDYEEVYLMSLCKNNIIANSTFSWWGAWLNKNKDKMVIAPTQWTMKKTSDELDILPKDWIQI